MPSHLENLKERVRSIHKLREKKEPTILNEGYQGMTPEQRKIFDKISKPGVLKK